jgi:hypothetical protein
MSVNGPMPIMQALVSATALYKTLDPQQIKLLDAVFLTGIKGFALSTMTSIPEPVQRIITISSSVEEVIANGMMDPVVVQTLMGGGGQTIDHEPINSKPQTGVFKCPSCDFMFTRDV